MFLMKALLLGDSASGKDALREGLFRRTYTSSYLMTIGAEFGIQKIYINGHEVKLQLWDLDGRERFNSVRSLYYSGSHGAILVFNVTQRTTFDNILHWVEELRHHLRSRIIPVLLIGNNIEFRDTSNQSHVTTEEGERLAFRIAEMLSGGQVPVPYIEISSLAREFIQEPFLLLAETIINFPAQQQILTPLTHEPAIIEQQPQLQVIIKNYMSKLYAKSLYQDIHLYAEHCIADRKILDEKALETAYYCNECKQYICAECLKTLQQSNTLMCLGSLITTHKHYINENLVQKILEKIDLQKTDEKKDDIKEHK